ncbi:MAG: hypothetical protein ACOCTK_02095 [Candidatus Saliniplasma sp.]
MGRPDTYLARKIKNAHEKGKISSTIIMGSRGEGKSVLAMYTIHDLYYNGYGYKDEDAWEMAMKYTIHGMRSIVEMGSEALNERDEPFPALHVDDAAFFLAGYDFNLNKKTQRLMNAFRKLVNVWREVTSGSMYTCEDPNELISFVKNRNHILVKVMNDANSNNEHDKVARIYTQDVWPSGTTKINADWQGRTFFNCHLPDQIYEKYRKQRRKYTGNAIKEIQKSLEELEKEEEEKKDDKKEFTPEQAARLRIKSERRGNKITYKDLEELTEVPHSTIQNRVEKLKI